MNIRFKNKLTRHIPRRRQNKRLCTTERLMMSTLSWPLYKVRVWWFCSFVFTIVLLTISNHSSPALIDCYWMKGRLLRTAHYRPTCSFSFFWLNGSIIGKSDDDDKWTPWPVMIIPLSLYTFRYIRYYTHTKRREGGGKRYAPFSPTSLK